MKKLFLFAAVLLSACGTTTISTTGPATPSVPNSSSIPAIPTQPAQPAYQGGGIGPVIVKNMNQGLGPVNIAESNFFFAGDFQIIDNQALFYDCMAGANIPLVTDKGVYNQLAEKYRAMAGTSGEVVRARIHGYFVDRPTSDYPRQLVVTYVNELSQGSICDRTKQLPGTWVAQLIGMEKGTVTLKLDNKFDFTATIAASSGTQNISGGWRMTSPQEVSLFYTTITPLMGNSVSFNPNNMTLFVPTQRGTLIFKKQ
ncbi:MAG: hypothetical protein ACRCSQ_00915 [Bacteroidales bacterium]